MRASQTSIVPVETSPVVVPHCRQFTFRSQINERSYAISVALPFEPPPADGYGVLYVLDGYAYFASAAEAVRSNLNAPGVMVVGIGYPETEDFVGAALAKRAARNMSGHGMPDFLAACAFERFYDLTLPSDPATLARESIPGLFELRLEDVGGLDEFLAVIEHEIKPLVAALAPPNLANQALFGHSLGGLAVLQALFTRPVAYRSFIAASPAIWWGGKAVLEGEPQFASQVGAGILGVRLLVTVGGKEERAPVLPKDTEIDPVRFADAIGTHRMIENAKALVSRLQHLNGNDAYHVSDCVIFTEQQHGIVPWPSLGRAIDFAFSKPLQ